MYRVIFTKTVNDGIDAQVAYYRSEMVAESTIAGWLGGLLEQIARLDEMPRRFPIAQAVSQVKGYPVHRMNYGVHAIYYRVMDDQRVVEIIAFRHGRQAPWVEEESP
jgi:plasmid stabilization system protein ParE